MQRLSDAKRAAAHLRLAKATRKCAKTTASGTFLAQSVPSMPSICKVPIGGHHRQSAALESKDWTNTVVLQAEMETAGLSGVQNRQWIEASK